MLTKIFHLLFLSFYVFFSINGQQVKDIEILNDSVIIKSKATKVNFLWNRDKYLKLKIKGEMINDQTNINLLNINIFDMENKKYNMRTLQRSTRNFREKNIICISYKKPKKDKFLEKRNYFFLKTLIKSSSLNSFAGYISGYSLEKGTYYLYVTYKEGRKIYYSNTIPLYVK